jgi:5-methyltetrahydrofolate--homocysteine methyltransferase
MGVVLDKLAERGLLVSDGAWGTMLQARGLGMGDCPEVWNVSHAADVRAVASAYVEAGSDLILTNTFGGTRLKLAKAGCEDRVAELNEAGVRLSLEGAGRSAIVAASVGPTGEFLEPLGTISAERMQEIFAEQIAALREAGVRAICVETFTAVEEAAAAVRAAKAVDPDMDVLCTLTFDLTPNGPRTMMGASPAQAVETLGDADVLGSNCGNGIEAMVAIAGAFRALTDKPLLIHANAGLPELVDGQTVFRQSPEDFAAHVRALVEAGANIIGGCCGTTPNHIAAMKTVVDELRGSERV